MQPYNKEDQKLPERNKIKFYKDFEELKEAETEYIVNTDLLKRVVDTMNLIKRVYGEHSLPAGFPGKITFINVSL